jgi:hypothetical protein
LHALGGKLTDIKGQKYKYHAGVEVQQDLIYFFSPLGSVLLFPVGFWYI